MSGAFLTRTTTSNVYNNAELLTNGNQNFQFSEPMNDASNRLRVSEPVTLLDYQSQYDDGALLHNTKIVAGGTSTHTPVDASVLLSVAAATDKVVRSTKAYYRYQAGKSHLIMQTFALSAAQTNLVQRVGYFDGANGVFLELSDNTLSWVQRSSTSGAPVDTKVARADWNISSQDDLDFTNAQLMFLDLEWLGVGRVRCGFIIAGHITYTHQFLNGTSSEPFMTTPNLPVTHEIEATGVLATSPATMRVLCCTVITEGGQQEQRVYPFCASNGIITKAVTTRRAVLSIRPKALFKAQTNRTQVTLTHSELFAETNAAFVEVIWNGVLGGTPSWTSVNAESAMEFDVAGTTVTGGQCIGTYFVPATTKGGGQPRVTIQGMTSKLPICLDHDGLNPINVSIVVTAFTGTTNVSSSIEWHESR